MSVCLCLCVAPYKQGVFRHVQHCCRSLSAGRTYGTGLNSWGSSWGLLCRAQSYPWWWETKQQLWPPAHCCSEKGSTCLPSALQLFPITPAGRGFRVCIDVHKGFWRLSTLLKAVTWYDRLNSLSTTVLLQQCYYSSCMCGRCVHTR